ncbi:uncharacterized protein SPSK_00138 [Sporothrix schenckii 1099-18]|uniref:Uncharacterized protein n=1 Tax=Sporothrix schenckii 1099-18 TaxID=1397361 RepID=A0A0F2M1X6_SPOSC|nr:uncharacterized protein SPSK_00138 [Sporothrix schenckii 1099-18]KJR83707.1 hypothetical protein SPSK_00138 [Sporothrix schenckii 1099-18]
MGQLELYDAPPPYGSNISTYPTSPAPYDMPSASPTPAQVQADDQEVDELAAHYRQYIPSVPGGGGGFGAASSALSPPAGLARPILIPQAYAAGFTQPPAPFLRAYPPVLGDAGMNIPPALFVAMIDALNLCMAPPPPLQALNLVGQGVGFVPSHIAQGVSAGLGVVAGVGVAAARITQLKKFLARVNADVFAPRGLVMEVVKDEAALRMVGVSPSMLPPVLPQQARGVAGTGPGVAPLNALVHTRLTQLAPHTSPLSFHVPPAAVPTSLMDRITARQKASRLAKDARRAEKQQQMRDRKMRKMEGRMDRQSLAASSDSGDSSSAFSSYSEGAAAIHAKADSRRQMAEQQGDWKAVAKIEKKRAKEMEDFDKKQRKHGGKHHDRHQDKQQRKYDKDMHKMDKKDQKQGEKDQKTMGKLQWIVIRNRQ